MTRQAHITLVNGIETSVLDIADRGLAYGDGLFETMRVVDNKIPLFQWHLNRFSEGVEKLGLGTPKSLVQNFEDQVAEALKRFTGEAVVKVIVTRGLGGGYEPPREASCSFVVQVFDLPYRSRNFLDRGVQVTLCKYRLAHQPCLAGIKHLNRLDQVLAARELKGQHEGMLLDQNGLLVEGLKSNILVFNNEKVLTPSLELCGVKGTLRQYLLDKGPFDIEEATINKQDLMAADGIALVNSVFGIWSVKEIDRQEFAIHPKCEKIREHLSNELGFN